MPPVDILHEYYAAGLAVDGIVQVPQLIDIHVKKLTATGPKGKKGQVKITAITIRESHTDLVPMPAPHGHRAHDHPHHHGHNHGHQKAHHHGHNKVHHHKHHERIDHRQHTRPMMTGGVPSRPCTHHMHHGHHHHHHNHSHHNHTLPVHHGDYQAPVPEKPSTVAEYARFEVLCLIASLALSMVLLYVGYRIGDRICNYENARSQHGRGHRHARIHREVIWSSADEKQGLLENEQVSGDSDEEEAVESQPVPIAAPQVARTRK